MGYTGPYLISKDLLVNVPIHGSYEKNRGQGSGVRGQGSIRDQRSVVSSLPAPEVRFAFSMRRRAEITGKVQAENIRHGINGMREIWGDRGLDMTGSRD
jgi:hypothetical protein